MRRKIKGRLLKLEKQPDRKPPFDLVGKYYDSLSPGDRLRFWSYTYGDAYTVEQAERLEVNYISGTLHFVCNLKPGDFDFPELDAITAAWERW